MFSHSILSFSLQHALGKSGGMVGAQRQPCEKVAGEDGAGVRALGSIERPYGGLLVRLLLRLPLSLVADDRELSTHALLASSPPK
jgi:hypothetical protein